MRRVFAAALAVIGALGLAVQTEAQQDSAVSPKLPQDLSVERELDVIYGRKDGLALTMDVYRPEGDRNGAGIVLVISGGWVSNKDAMNKLIVEHFLPELIKRGDTVFAVMHGSQPKYTVPEAVSDLNRAVRYIRHHASDFGVDPQRLGITGASAGGHLSLMQGTAGDLGNQKADDPVERESSRVQAVACLFPPTDFLNYGGDGEDAFATNGVLARLRPVVDVREPNADTQRFERLSDEKQHELEASISPITHVSSDDPPTLIIHGDADKLVPHQQAERILKEFNDAGVTAEVLTRPGRGHDFNGAEPDIAAIADWFDKYLAKK